MKRLFLLFLLSIYTQYGVSAQIITTVAGNGTCGYTGENILATTEELNYPSDIAVDKFGNFYFSERLNNRIRKVSSEGIISTVAGNGTSGFSGDGGAATLAQLNAPSGVTVDSIGNIYVADLDNYRVRKVDAVSHIITTVVGNGASTSAGDGGAATNASISGAVNVYFSNSGNLYVVDFAAKIRMVKPDGIIYTVAGTGVGGFSGDGGAATAAQINPVAITTDRDENIYIAEWGNARVRKVNAISKEISTIVGTGTFAYNGDGIAASIAQVSPFGLVFDNFGNLYIADMYNNRIRTVNTNGIIETVAGNGTNGFAGDGDIATAAEIYYPEGIGLDSCGNIFIADEANCRVRKVTYPVCGYLGVSPYSANNKLKIYPNPIVDFVNIDNVNSKSFYDILNIVGVVVKHGILNEGDNKIVMDDVPEGIYFLIMTDENSNKSVKKIIKE